MSEVLGTVVRLQVQTGHLKPRPSGSGRYDPSPLRQVEALRVDAQGCTGLIDGESVVDLHHADHPESRNVRGVNGLSLLPSAHYDRLRSTYGDHLRDGVAGENVLLRTAGPWTVEDLRGDLALEVDGGSIALTAAMAAPPCVEFSRWCLGRSESGPLVSGRDEAVAIALEDLDHGGRGFYLRVTGSGVVRPGALLLRA